MKMKGRILELQKQRLDFLEGSRKDIELIQSNLQILESLSEDYSFNWVSGRIRISAYCSSESDVQEINRQTRTLLGVRRSKKEFIINTGKIRWITKNEYIIAVVEGGDIPKNCTVSETKVDRIVYSMNCED